MILISFIIISLYILYCIIQNGIPDSLSATYYNNGITFNFTTLISTILIIPKMFDSTPNSFQFLVFISIFGILLVAFTPDYRKYKLVDLTHSISAICSLITSQIWVGLMDWTTLLLWIPVLFYIGLMFISGNKTVPKIKFIAEVIMLITIYNVLWKM